VCELAIRDLKAGAGLAHLPSGRFAANAAWLLAATLAHNLLRWTASLGLGVDDQQTVAKTLRRTLLALPGRLTARRGSGGCTCPPAGRGPTRSPWRWRGWAAFPTRPDRSSTPWLGWSAGRRPLRPAITVSEPTPGAAQPPAGHPHPPHPAIPPSRNASVRAPRPARTGNNDHIRASVDPG
jgi:hypothetical protein